MNFSFSGRHMEIGESLTVRARESFDVLAKKYDCDFIDVSIVMKKENYLYCSDISVKSKLGNLYHAGNDANDPINSFTGAFQKIELQIKKKKKNCRCSNKNSGVEFVSYDNSLKKDESNPIIIAEILEDLPLMSVSDATEHLSDNKRVFVFENISNNSVNVVYKRNDGNFGWIDYKTKI